MELLGLNEAWPGHVPIQAGADTHAVFEGSPVLETDLGTDSRSIRQVVESAGTDAAIGLLSWSPQLHALICWQLQIRLASLEKTEPAAVLHGWRCQSKRTFATQDRPPTGSTTLLIAVNDKQQSCVTKQIVCTGTPLRRGQVSRRTPLTGSAWLSPYCWKRRHEGKFSPLPCLQSVASRQL